MVFGYPGTIDESTQTDDEECLDNQDDQCSVIVPGDSVAVETYNGTRKVFSDKQLYAEDGTPKEVTHQTMTSQISGQKTSVTNGNTGGNTVVINIGQ